MLNQKLIFQLGQIIGLDEEYLKELNEQYQKANKDKRYQIMEILWDGFFKLLKRLTAIKYQQYLAEVALGKRKLENDLYQQAQQEIKEYFLKILSGEAKDEKEIESLRKKIYSLAGFSSN